MTSPIAEAAAHFQRFHARPRRRSGFVPALTPKQIEASRAEKRRRAEQALGEAIDGLPDDLREEIVRRTVAAQDDTAIELLASALPPKREPVPHGIEGCGEANAEERRIIAAGLLVRVRDDVCNDPGCRLARLPRDRHVRAHRHQLDNGLPVR